MSLQTEQMLAHYRLVEKIGEGGMGVVWKATDTVLDRPVAIKILPADLSGNPERLARFEREAKVLATLNDSGIAGVYGLHSASLASGETLHFLAMEFVPGEDLAERIARGALDIDEVLEVATQIATALETAHENGIVHRDLKPANVRLTPDGTVKVLDFGLAKVPGSDTLLSGTDPGMSPTMTSAGSVAGMLMGTAAYMSPEQARGRMVDRRADIWAFGCLLYEMLTGKQAFPGETVSDSLAAILRGEADLEALPADTPHHVRRLLGRCLEKDARQRLRDIGDARLELSGAGDLATGIDPAVVGVAGDPVSVARGRWLFAGVGVLVGALLGGLLLGGLFAPAAPPAEVIHASQTLPDGLDTRTGNITMPMALTLSADGSTIALIGRLTDDGGENPRRSIWVRKLSEREYRVIASTEGAFGRPRFTEDGQSLLYLRQVRGQREIAKVPIDGDGPPTTFVQLQDEWGATFTTLPGGRTLIDDRDDLGYFIIDAEGNAGPRIAVESNVPTATFRFGRSEPVPGRDTLLLEAINYDKDGWAVSIVKLDVATGQAELLIEDAGNPKLAYPGYLVFTRSDQLLAIRFDAEKVETAGNEVGLMAGLRTEGPYLPAQFELSTNGTLLFGHGGLVAEKRRIVMLESDGTLKELDVAPKAFSGASPLAMSGDGSTFAAVATNARGIDEIWVSEFEDPFLRRVTSFEGADSGNPALSATGSHMVFTVNANDDRNGIYLVPTDASAPPRRVHATPEGTRVNPTSVSPDLRWLLADVFPPQGNRYVGLLRLPDEGAGEATGEIEPLAADIGFSFFGMFSRDGKRLSLAATRSGAAQVYVATFDGKVGRQVPVTRNGGAMALWNAGDRSLTYVSDNTIWTVPLGSDGLTPGTPVQGVRVDRTNWIGGTVAPDGRVIAIAPDEAEAELDRIEIVLGYFSELAQRF